MDFIFNQRNASTGLALDDTAVLIYDSSDYSDLSDSNVSPNAQLYCTFNLSHGLLCTTAM